MGRWAQPIIKRSRRVFVATLKTEHFTEAAIYPAQAKE